MDNKPVDINNIVQLGLAIINFAILLTKGINKMKDKKKGDFE